MVSGFLSVCCRFYSFLAIETAMAVTQGLDGTFVGRFLDTVATV